MSKSNFGTAQDCVLGRVQVGVKLLKLEHSGNNTVSDSKTLHVDVLEFRVELSGDGVEINGKIHHLLLVTSATFDLLIRGRVVAAGFLLEHALGLAVVIEPLTRGLKAFPVKSLRVGDARQQGVNLLLGELDLLRGVILGFDGLGRIEGRDGPRLQVLQTSAGIDIASGVDDLRHALKRAVAGEDGLPRALVRCEDIHQLLQVDFPLAKDVLRDIVRIILA